MASVTLRVSDGEKELWVFAAGGSRRLSAWLRECAAARLAGEGVAVNPDGVASVRSVPPVSRPVSIERVTPPSSVSRGFDAVPSVARREFKPDFKVGTKL